MDSYKSLSDDELLALFKEGDSLAYDEIYYRYWAVLFRHGRKMLQNNEDAKDLVQDVFYTFWKNGCQLELKVTLSAYLYALLRYKVFDLIDRNKVKTNYLSSIQTFITVNEYSADHLVREKQLEALIEKEIASLPEKMRAVFELSRKANLSYKEIAVQLDITDNTVKKQISNALRILRAKISASIFSIFF